MSEEIAAQIGASFRSDWMMVDQAMIDDFADVTIDHQYIHVDPVRAAETPFGGTVAHGFLTLSLLSRLMEVAGALVPVEDGMTVNYGFDKVRFVNPVRSGSRIRAHFTLAAQEEKRPGQLQRSVDVVMEIEGTDRPALTATWLFQIFT